MDVTFQTCPICGSKSLKEVSETIIVNYKTVEDRYYCYNCGCEQQGSKDRRNYYSRVIQGV